MEVILLEKVRNLGAMGEQVKVKGGYGRNFLIPKGKAVPATKSNIEVFNEKKAELEAKAEEKLAAAHARAEKLGSVSVQISSKAGDEGKLFGSIGTRDIADAITEAGVEVSKSEVILSEGAIRNVGDYDVNIQLHPDVVKEITISIISE